MPTSTKCSIILAHEGIDKGTGRWSCFKDKNPSNLTRNDYSLKIQKWSDARVVVNRASKEVKEVMKTANAKAAREVKTTRVAPRKRLEEDMVVDDVPEVPVGSDSEVRSLLTNPTTRNIQCAHRSRTLLHKASRYSSRKQHCLVNLCLRT